MRRKDILYIQKEKRRLFLVLGFIGMALFAAGDVLAGRSKHSVIPLPFLYDILSVGGKSFAEYLYVFLVGYYVFSSDKALEQIEKYRYVSLFVGLVAGITDVYMFIWSEKDFGMINTIAKAFTEWFMILALMGIGKHAMNHAGKVSDYLSKRAFLFFSIHFLWIVLFQYWFSGLIATNTAVAYIVPIVFAYPATFICTEIAYRIPALCFLMGVKSKSDPAG